MTLFDQIVESDSIGSGYGRASDMTAGSRSALASFGDKLPFRGILSDVIGVTNGELQRRAGLDWTVSNVKACAMVAGGPVGPGGYIEAPNWRAIVRDDTNEVLTFASDKFQVHQNSDILREAKELAEVGGAQICYAGALDGGRKVVAVARLDGEFALPNERDRNHRNDHAGADYDDKTYLFAVLTGGHEPGTPRKVRGMAFRKWCGNGAFFTVAANATYICTHRQSLTGEERQRLAEVFQRIRGEFQVYGDSARRLLKTRMDKDQARLYVAELLKPGLAEQVAIKLTGNYQSDRTIWEAVAQDLRGKQALDAVLKANEDAAGMARNGKQLLDAIMTEQEGRNGDNLWSGFNGVTWFVDNKRGRTAESGVDAALFGAGAVLKERALVTAHRFAEAN